MYTVRVNQRPVLQVHVVVSDTNAEDEAPNKFIEIRRFANLAYYLRNIRRGPVLIFVGWLLSGNLIEIFHVNSQTVRLTVESFDCEELIFVRSQSLDVRQCIRYRDHRPQFD